MIDTRECDRLIPLGRHDQLATRRSIRRIARSDSPRRRRRRWGRPGAKRALRRQTQTAVPLSRKRRTLTTFRRAGDAAAPGANQPSRRALNSAAAWPLPDNGSRAAGARPLHDERDGRIATTAPSCWVGRQRSAKTCGSSSPPAPADSWGWARAVSPARRHQVVDLAPAGPPSPKTKRSRSPASSLSTRRTAFSEQRVDLTEARPQERFSPPVTARGPIWPQRTPPPFRSVSAPNPRTSANAANSGPPTWAIQDSNLGPLPYQRSALTD